MKKKIFYFILSVILLMTACTEREEIFKSEQESSMSMVSQTVEENNLNQHVLENSLTGYYRRSVETLDGGHINMDFFIFQENGEFYGYLNMMGYEHEGDWTTYPQAVMFMELLENQGVIEAYYIKNLAEVKQDEYWGEYQEGDLLFSINVEEVMLHPTWEKLSIREKEESKDNEFVLKESYLSVMLTGERDKDVFLRAVGISEKDVPIYRYGNENMPLLVYYDELAGKGLGLYYTEDYIIGFDIPECEQRKWQDQRYDVTKDGISGSEAENYRENREYNDSGQLTCFESKGIETAGPEGPHEDTLIQIEFFYREDGTLEKKKCYYNSYVFGTYRGTETYYYDEKERLEYVYAYVTHGSLEEFYIYEDNSNVPSYCLVVDHFGADACTESFVQYVDEISNNIERLPHFNTIVQQPLIDFISYCC